MSDVSVITPGPQGPPPYRPVVAWAPFDSDAPVTYFKAPYASVVEVDGSLYECLVTHQPGVDFAVDLAAGKWRLLVSAQLTAEWQAIVDANFAAAATANETAQAAQQASEDARDVAEDERALAEAAAELAVAERSLAQLARDAALAYANVKPDIATGRASVADGALFAVVGSLTGNVGASLYRRDSSTTQTLIATLPSSARVEDISDRADILKLFSLIRATTNGNALTFGDEPNSSGIANVTARLDKDGLFARLLSGSATFLALDDDLGGDALAVKLLRSMVRPSSTDDLTFGDKPDPSGIANVTGRLSRLTGKLTATLDWQTYALSGTADYLHQQTARVTPGKFKTKVVGGKSQIVRIGGDGVETVISPVSTVDDTDPEKVGLSIQHLSTLSGAGEATFSPPIAAEAAIPRAYRMSPDGANRVRESNAAHLLTSASDVVYLVWIWGQSNGAGQSPALTTVVRKPGMAMMPNGGWHLGIGYDQTTDLNTVVSPANIASVVDYVSEAHETVAAGLAYRLAEADDIRTCSINTSFGDQGFSTIRKGTVPWSNGIAAIRALTEIYSKLGFRVEVLTVQMHGEFNKNLAPPGYYNFLTQMRQDLRDDIIPLTGQSAVHMVILPAVGIRSADTDLVRNDMWRFCRDNADARWVGSTNKAEMRDYQHYDSAGLRLVGDGDLYRVVKSVITTGTYAAFQPTNTTAQRSGATITIPLSGNTGTIRFLADADFPEVSDGNKGLSYVHPTLSIAIASVAISGSSVIVTLASDPGAIVAGEYVRGAYAGYSASSLADATARPRTNVADSDPLVSRIDGRSLPKRLGPFQLSVVA